MTAVLGFEPRLKRDPVVVTQSDLKAYKLCRRQWLLGHYLGLERRSKPTFGPLPLGSRVHKALEPYYRGAVNPDTGAVWDPRTAYAQLCQWERDNLLRLQMPLERDEWEREAELGAIMLQGYVEWLAETGADSEYEIIGAEQKLSHRLNVGGVEFELRGKVDIRARNITTGARLVVDTKTTSHFSNLEMIASYDEQLLFYLLLERLTWPNQPESWLQGAMFNMLRKVRRTVRSKPPYYMRLEVHHNEQTLRSFWYRLQGMLTDYAVTVNALDQGQDHKFNAYPTSGPQCRYCPFRIPCLLMDDGSAAEEMLNGVYRQHDPHERYETEPAAFLPDTATYAY